LESEKVGGGGKEKKIPTKKVPVREPEGKKRSWPVCFKIEIGRKKEKKGEGEAPINAKKWRPEYPSQPKQEKSPGGEAHDNLPSLRTGGKKKKKKKKEKKKGEPPQKASQQGIRGEATEKKTKNGSPGYRVRKSRVKPGRKERCRRFVHRQKGGGPYTTNHREREKTKFLSRSISNSRALKRRVLAAKTRFSSWKRGKKQTTRFPNQSRKESFFRHAEGERETRKSEGAGALGGGENVT